MPARKFLAASSAAVLSLGATLALAGDWLGGQYWGQIAGCADCGGSMYGGGLPPGAIWVGEIGWGEGPGCGGECGGHSEIVPRGDAGSISTTISDGLFAPPQASHAAQQTSRRVSYIEAVEPVERAFQPRREQIRVITHTSQPERLHREPIRIVSPDGSAGRVYR